jgi:hypothetical protein
LCDFRKDGKMQQTQYASSAASLFAAHARELPVFGARECQCCGLTYACKSQSSLCLHCPVCQSVAVRETTTREALPERWTEYLDAYIGECLADGADWVAVAQKPEGSI